MKSNSKKNMLVSAVVMLFIALLAGGCASCRNKKAEAEPKNQKDSIEQPEPLAPPVIHDHSWREELNKQE